ncbi:MAG: hypothetical protein QXF12_06135 [Candidatus Aenigmatarchaeota archaeon]
MALFEIANSSSGGKEMAVKIESGQQASPQSQSQSSPINLNIGFHTNIPISGSGGEMYEKIYDYFKKKFDTLKEYNYLNSKYGVVRVLKDVYGLNYSSVVVFVGSDDKFVAHPLIVEKTGPYPDKLIENVGGIKYEILRTPSDALDEKYASSVIHAISTSFNIDPNKIIIADGTLVPNHFDHNSENYLNDLFSNVVRAIEYEFYAKDYTGINVFNLINEYRNGRFVINIYFNNEDNSFFDCVSNPIRQDICVQTLFKVNTVNNKSINQGNDTVELVKVYGYIDFEFSPMVQTHPGAPIPKFIPNFIMTHLDTGRLAPTPDLVLLGIASCLSINTDLYWLHSFKGGLKKEVFPLKDIGMLNIEANIENNQSGYGKPYDTKGKNVTPQEIVAFVQRVTRNMIFSIDVPQCNPQTWYLSVFNHARNGDKNAISRINRYLANLTNGAANVSYPLFVAPNNKIHSGYYRVKDGIYDLRLISNYLAVAGFVHSTNQNPALINNYTNTLYNLAIPEQIRASERFRILEHMLSAMGAQSYVVGFHDRLIMSNMFITNLVAGLKAAGYSPTFGSVGVSSDMFIRRSIQDFNAAAVGQDVNILGTSNPFTGVFTAPVYNRPFY